MFTRPAAIILLAAFLSVAPFQAALAATAPPLGTAQSFAVVAGDAVTNTGASDVTGDLGVSPGSAVIGFTGLPDGTVSGAIHAADAVALQAKSDSRTGYNNLTLQGCTTTYIVPTNLSGLVLVPGVYCFASSAGLAGPVPLTLVGGVSDVWVFKTVSTLITGPGSSVVMSGGGQECNVFWQVGSAATLDTTTQFIGNILAHDDISLNNGANVNGRLLAGMQANGAGAVTMINNNITPAVCSVAVPPTLVKVFSPDSIDVGGNSTLTITLSNSNSTAITGALLTDTLPGGVTFFSPATTDCTGDLLTSGETVTLTGGLIPANSFCTVTATVTSSVVGPHINTVALTSDQGDASASDTLTVLTPASTAPTLSKTFNPANINVGGNSTLTITLGNTNSTVASFATFTDTLPIGVTFVAAASNNGCGGTIANDANTVTLTGGSIPANGSCTVTATVTSPIPGLHLNTTGALVTDQGTAPPASDTLIVNQITIAKAFTPDTIAVGGVSLLTITVTNPNSSIATPVAFADFLPSSPGQMLVAPGPAPLINTCGGTLTAAPGSSAVIYAGGLLPIGPSSCTVTVYVTAAVAGDYTNTLGTAVAILTVTPPVSVAPTLSKSFSPSTINAGGISTVTIILTNPGDTAATLIAPFIDTLPSGLVVAGSGPNASTTCGGTLTAITGQSTVTLTGGSIPANSSCTIKFDVYAPVAGTYVNTLASGTLQTSNGNNAVSVVATLIVNPRAAGSPKLCKSFLPSTIKASGVSTLTINLHNPNNTVATLIAPLTDYFPSGLVVAGTGLNASTTCGGTLTAITGAAKIILTGGSIPANSSCRVKVDVTAKDKGSYYNKLPAGALQTNKGSNVTSARATLTVLSATIAPKLGKAFSPSTIKAGGVSTVTITLSNLNSTVAKLTAALTDYFPSGLVVAATGPNVRTTCGGTVTASKGSSKVTLTGGSIPGYGSCTVKVDVTAKYKGSYCNKLSAGALRTDKGSNVSSTAATLTVLSANIAPKLGKAFSPSTIKAGGVSTLTITLSNLNSTVAKLTAPLTDYFPSGLVVAGIGPNARTTCGGTLTASKGSSKVTLTGGSIPANDSCTVKVDVTAKYKHVYYNKLPVGALQTNKGSNVTSATATLTVQ